MKAGRRGKGKGEQSMFPVSGFVSLRNPIFAWKRVSLVADLDRPVHVASVPSPRRTKWLLNGAVILTVLVLGIYFFRGAEPVYQGRNLSEWLRDLKVVESEVVNLIDRHEYEFVALNLPNNPDHNRAVEAIQKLGTSSIPYLQEKLRNKSAELDELQWNYLFAAYVLGPKAEGLTADILAADECVSLKASILRRVGPAATPHIVRLLHSNRGGDLSLTLSLIPQMGDLAPLFIPEVINFIKACPDKEGWDYRNALSVLAGITDEPRKTQAVLLPLFVTGDSWAQESIARGMWRWNTNGKAFGPELLKVVRRPNTSREIPEFVLQTKTTVAIALVRVDPQMGTNCVPILNKALTNEESDSEMLVHTLRALEVLGAYSVPALPGIKATLTHKDMSVRVEATNAFSIVSNARNQSSPLKSKRLKEKQ